MRRRARIDLGQQTSAREEVTLERKKQRWLATNKHRAEENPFLKAIKPDQDYYGEPEEFGEELAVRLKNLEFGNFPGYFNYRNKASQEKKDNANSKCGESQGNKNKRQLGADQSTSQMIDNNSETALEVGMSDERLQLLKKEWFAEKNVLDIGCNRGHITYAIARLYSPKSIVGIDIDLKMINMANRDLHLHLEEGLMKEAQEYRQKRALKLRLEDGVESYVEDQNQFAFSSYISQGPLTITGEDTVEESSKESGDTREFRFPNNIVFVEHNYVLSKDELIEKQKAHFDTIVCLSVTKWIHLNYRDDGLKRFFKRIYKHLRPNGLLILEAQPFDNYARRKRLSDRLKANYYSIQFKPDSFDDYLLSEQVGFRRIISETVTEHDCNGFKRPLKVYLK